MIKERIIREYNGEYGQFFKSEADKKVSLYKNTFKDNDIIRWKSNNQIPPKELLMLWNYVGFEFDYERNVEQQQEEIKESLNKYRNINSQKSEEELFELRANFDKNTTIVDVITGELFIV